MKNTLKKIFITPFKSIPEKVKTQLKEHFPGALNIEWEAKKEIYEAIFYVNDVEYIAKISEKNGLQEYKKNLRTIELPKEISAECEKSGEIMNAIANYVGNDLFYEIIIRDKDFNRSLMLLNKSGELLKSTRI